ncbi:hypothetical protein EV186_104208 [Labedaea rhizosphaerae]|uniref:Uncharacterized protein n=1 Tax=Labedaea rhizosphaerae TaxID=598644 RepID=A0A4R6SB66_LABRH|nr:hypothetical protein EV186_104208 [Labedaea rhizosphaerae]
MADNLTRLVPFGLGFAVLVYVLHNRGRSAGRPLRGGTTHRLCQMHPR